MRGLIVGVGRTTDLVTIQEVKRIEAEVSRWMGWNPADNRVIVLPGSYAQEVELDRSPQESHRIGTDQDQKG